MFPQTEVKGHLTGQQLIGSQQTGQVVQVDFFILELRGFEASSMFLGPTSKCSLFSNISLTFYQFVSTYLHFLGSWDGNLQRFVLDVLSTNTSSVTITRTT